MNRNRVPWTIAIVSLAMALVVGIVAISPRVMAQDVAIPGGPVVAVPIDGPLAVEPAVVDPAEAGAIVGSGFTYQGVLNSGNAPANGSFDFQFQLFNSGGGGGVQRGPTLVAEDVPVTDGRFSTLLDFGNIFGTESLWISVHVRNGASTGAFTGLTPKQGLSAVPIASFASKSGDSSALQAQINALLTQVDTLTTQVNTLNTKMAAQQTLLTGVTSEDGGATLRITGRNLQVVSGSGTTNGVVNGKGNIIIGYNEVNIAYPGKSGSHMLVVGPGHNYESYGGVVFGLYNRAIAPYANVLGGTGNWSNGIATVAVGGEGNHPQGNHSVAVGGYGNYPTGTNTVVVGGEINTTSGSFNVVSGGSHNSAAGIVSTISGGYQNSVIGDNEFTTIGGGHGVIYSGVTSGLWRGNTLLCVPDAVQGNGC